MNTKKYIKVETPQKCLIWHRWKMINDSGINLYFECKDCKSRYALSGPDGYQPFDIDWVMGKRKNF